LVDIFALIAQQKNQAEYGEEYSVLVSFIEVYNEQVYDLLEPTGRVLAIREDQERSINK
jgi:hypothetical protein